VGSRHAGGEMADCLLAMRREKHWLKMSPFARLHAISPRHMIASVGLIAVMATLVIWSMLLNATDIVAGLMDHTGSTPTRRP
jgi:hypothetical protein